MRPEKTAATMAARITGRWRKLFRQNGITVHQCDEYAAAFDHDQMDVALAASSLKFQSLPH